MYMYQSYCKSQVETSEVCDINAETSAEGIEESEIKTEAQVEPNGYNEVLGDVRPEHRLADDIQCGRTPTQLTESERRRILGGQANVWTEYIDNEETCEYMLFPRLCAFSEAVW